MIKEFDRYQNIKQTILLSAWYEIEISKQGWVSQHEIVKGIEQLLDKYSFTAQKIKTLLEETVLIDKWLFNPKNFNNKKNIGAYSMTPKGRREIDKLLSTKAQKLRAWLVKVAPSAGAYVGEIILKKATL